ncbi:MAG: hypothetical protein HQK53_12100 [Oligoflexia bacterium]|nr:hypothetical protein [Oligoflexia bacterium]
MYRKYQGVNAFNRGFTTIEMLITSIITATTILFAVNYFKQINKNVQSTTENIQTTIGLFGGSKIIQDDLFNGVYSFNFLCLLDDSNKDFFTYISERQSAVASDYTDPAFKRSIKLSVPTINKGYSRDFYLIAIDSSTLAAGYRPAKIPIDPYWPYNDKAVPPVYKGINDKTLPSHNNKDLSNTNDFQGTPWIKNALLIISTAIAYHDETFLSECDSTTFSVSKQIKRPLRFIGVVDGDPSTTTILSNLNNFLGLNVFSNQAKFITNYKIADAYTNSVSIDSEQKFYDNLVVDIGRNRETFIEKINILRYRIQANDSKEKGGKLLRSKLECYRNSTNQEECNFRLEYILIDNIRSITFTRNILFPLINYSIEIEKVN